MIPDTGMDAVKSFMSLKAERFLARVRGKWGKRKQGEKAEREVPHRQDELPNPHRSSECIQLEQKGILQASTQKLAERKKYFEATRKD